MSGGPLAGVRVIDQTSVVVGPICTRSLADQGADVIKVEPPAGDLLRNLDEGARHAGMSGKILNFNRNKRSVCLDLKHPDGMAALRTLIAGADVFVSNVRPKALRRLREGRPESIETSSLHLDVLRDLKRIHSHICAVAYPALEAAGELQASRLKNTDPSSTSRASLDEPSPP